MAARAEITATVTDQNNCQATGTATSGCTYLLYARASATTVATTCGNVQWKHSGCNCYCKVLHLIAMVRWQRFSTKRYFHQP
ncbi:MAG: hypothetical protein U0T72_07725 [Chitinophagales bacterium]